MRVLTIAQTLRESSLIVVLPDRHSPAAMINDSARRASHSDRNIENQRMPSGWAVILKRLSNPPGDRRANSGRNSTIGDGQRASGASLLRIACCCLRPEI